MNRRYATILILIIVILGFGLTSIYLCFVPRGYYDRIPAYWKTFGVGLDNDNILHGYQGFVAGDLFQNGTLVGIGAWSHGQVGMFVHRQVGGVWNVFPIDWCFDPANPEGYPTKHIQGVDIDDDSALEILTGFDKISYLYGETQTDARKWAGAIYMELNTDGIEVLQPLIWGKWGERLCHENVSSCIPVVTPAGFSQPENSLKHILISTLTNIDNDSYIDRRIFLLEQPLGGFSQVNYTFTSPSILGTPPYEDPAFYVKQLFVRESTLYREMTWAGDGLLSAQGVSNPFPACIDVNGDGWLDLVVPTWYMQGEQAVPIMGILEVYCRVPTDFTHEYVFERSQVFNYTGYGIGNAYPFDVDGDLENGREGVATSLSLTTEAEEWITPALLTFIRDNGTLIEKRVLNTEFSTFPYYTGGVLMAPYDYDGDGYEDIVNMVYSYTQDGTAVTSVIFWKNRGPLSDMPFAWGDGNATILLDRQFLFYTLQLCQVDGDPTPELFTACGTRQPYWCPFIKGLKYAYYMSVDDVI